MTEEEFIEFAKKKGFEDWDIYVALGALKKGVTLNFGGKIDYAIRN